MTETASFDMFAGLVTRWLEQKNERIMSDVEELRTRVEAASERLLENDQRQRASSDRLSKLVQGIEERMSAKRTEIAGQDATIKQVTEENDRLVALVTELLDIIDRIDVPGLANFVDDLVSRMSDRVYDAVAAMPDLPEKKTPAGAAVPEPQPAPEVSAPDENRDMAKPDSVTAINETDPESGPDATPSRPADRSNPPEEQTVDASIALRSVVAKAHLGNRPGSGIGPDSNRKRPALRAVTGGRRPKPALSPDDPSQPFGDRRDNIGNRDEQRQGEDKALSIDQAGLQSVEVDALIEGQVSIGQLKQQIDERRRRADADLESDLVTSESDVIGLSTPLPDDAPEALEEDTVDAVDAVDAVDDGAEPKSVRSVLEGIIDELEDIEPGKEGRGNAANRRPDSGQRSDLDPTLTTKITSALRQISENDGD